MVLNWLINWFSSTWMIKRTELSEWQKNFWCHLICRLNLIECFVKYINSVIQNNGMTHWSKNCLSLDHIQKMQIKSGVAATTTSIEIRNWQKQTHSTTTTIWWRNKRPLFESKKQRYTHTRALIPSPLPPKIANDHKNYFLNGTKDNVSNCVVWHIKAPP